jgi:hypothetical protein
MKNNLKIVHAVLTFLYMITGISCDSDNSTNDSKSSISMYGLYGEYRSWQGYVSLDICDGEATTDLFYTLNGKPLAGCTVGFVDSTSNTTVNGNDQHNGNYFANLTLHAGDFIHVLINYTYHSQRCQVPDAYCTITSPVSGATVTPPFEINWTVNPGNYPVTALMLEIGTLVSVEYREVLPMTATTFTVTTSKMKYSGEYYIRITPYIPIKFSAAKISQNSRILVYSIHDPGTINVTHLPQQ